MTVVALSARATDASPMTVDAPTPRSCSRASASSRARNGEPGRPYAGPGGNPGAQLQDAVVEVAQRAFWDAIAEDVRQGRYETLFTLLEELEQSMRALIAHLPGAQADLKDKFDAQWIRQQAEHGALEASTVLNLMLYVAETIAGWTALADAERAPVGRGCARADDRARAGEDLDAISWTCSSVLPVSPAAAHHAGMVAGQLHSEEGADGAASGRVWASGLESSASGGINCVRGINARGLRGGRRAHVRVEPPTTETSSPSSCGWGDHRHSRPFFGWRPHTGAHVDPWTVANNFAVCSAIYDADRIEGPMWSRERAVTRAAAVASTAFYATDLHTVPLALLVPPLHLSYKDLKSAIAPVKPFFVAFLWTVAVYFVPIWRSQAGHVDPCLRALFLSIASISAVDGVDLEEDAAAGVRTPAVLMGDEGGAFAIGLGIASALLDASSLHPVALYDVLSLVSVLCISTRQPSATTAALGFACVAAYVATHDYELMTMVLRNTEFVHRTSIDVSTRLVERALALDEPWRSALIEPVLGPRRRRHDGPRDPRVVRVHHSPTHQLKTLALQQKKRRGDGRRSGGVAPLGRLSPYGFEARTPNCRGSARPLMEEPCPSRVTGANFFLEACR